jgi:large subunit ribosomal protein L10e
MALRKAKAYSKKKARPYTRKSKVKGKSFIKTVPNSMIVKFKMGDLKKFDKKEFPIVVEVVCKDKIQIRDNAIEAVRQFFNRFLVERVGNNEFYFETKVYPHHVLRENKMLTGAGADRMQTGMSQSFGKAIGRAALVKPNQVIFIIAVKTPKAEIEVRKLIKSAKSRLPCKIFTRLVKP